jgi:hypothetical protein
MRPYEVTVHETRTYDVLVLHPAGQEIRPERDRLWTTVQVWAATDEEARARGIARVSASAPSLCSSIRYHATVRRL